MSENIVYCNVPCNTFQPRKCHVFSLVLDGSIVMSWNVPKWMSCSVGPVDCPSNCLSICDDCMCTQHLLLYVVVHCGYFYGIFPCVPATREGGVSDASPGDCRLSQEVQRPPEAQGRCLCRHRGNVTNSIYAVIEIKHATSIGSSVDHVALFRVDH